MKFIATIEVDLDETPLGTPSRVADEIGGQTVLARTVRQVARSRRIAGLFVLCPESQKSRCEALLEGLPAGLRTFTVGPPAYRPLVRAIRKWSLDAWRGGIGGGTVIDEYLHTALLASLAAQEGADAVAVVPGPCPLMDPAVVDRLIEHFCAVAEDMRMTFMQTPPGLSPFIVRRELLDALAREGIPPGWTMTYKPDQPDSDLATRKCSCESPQPLRHASGRMIADTSRSFEAIAAYLAEHEFTSAEHVGQWLLDREAARVHPLPREVEIELTTEEPFGGRSPVALRPPLPANRRCEPIDPALVRRVADELAVHDDALVVLGGCGEPLAHPALPQILSHLREAGVYGIAIRTDGTRLDDDVVAALIEHHVDVVSVFLDAWTPERYTQLHGGEMQPVLEAMERLNRARMARNQPEPLLVPEMIKSVQTVDEMEAFFDGWLRKHGWATLIGFNRYGDALPDYSVVDMTPATRTPCRRIRSRCTVLADGRVLACDQDFMAVRPVGSLIDQSLAELWTGPTITTLRESHADGRFDGDPLCTTCTEWHRP